MCVLWVLLPACRFFLGTWNMAGFLSENRPIRTLREILTRLRETYSGNIGFEVGGRGSLWEDAGHACGPLWLAVCVCVCAHLSALQNFCSRNVRSTTAPATAATTAMHTHTGTNLVVPVAARVLRCLCRCVLRRTCTSGLPMALFGAPLPACYCVVCLLSVSAHVCVSMCLYPCHNV